MTPSEWISHAYSEMRAEQRAGNSINSATAEALADLLPGWEESIKKDGISCSVVLHDLKEVAWRLNELYKVLGAKLPNILEELAEIKKD